ncbi:hypothetical protein M0813_08036 [Anaeramoeba flamelloides]|uniref:Uncharacterized protein n=1 Tax=Anaeramoeba flamelloides TaxID=1746091 RepID=A0ABQ8X9A8_9EUKA|nr:hypothetical protein M0813_08036 [Anaeramoeba flamelloides]
MATEFYPLFWLFSHYLIKKIPYKLPFYLDQHTAKFIERYFPCGIDHYPKKISNYIEIIQRILIQNGAILRPLRKKGKKRRKSYKQRFYISKVWIDVLDQNSYQFKFPYITTPPKEIGKKKMNQVARVPHKKRRKTKTKRKKKKTKTKTKKKKNPIKWFDQNRPPENLRANRTIGVLSFQLIRILKEKPYTIKRLTKRSVFSKQRITSVLTIYNLLNLVIQEQRSKKYYWNPEQALIIADIKPYLRKIIKIRNARKIYAEKVFSLLNDLCLKYSSNNNNTSNDQQILINNLYQKVYNNIHESFGTISSKKKYQNIKQKKIKILIKKMKKKLAKSKKKRLIFKKKSKNAIDNLQKQFFLRNKENSNYMLNVQNTKLQDTNTKNSLGLTTISNVDKLNSGDTQLNGVHNNSLINDLKINIENNFDINNTNENNNTNESSKKNENKNRGMELLNEVKFDNKQNELNQDNSILGVEVIVDLFLESDYSIRSDIEDENIDSEIYHETKIGSSIYLDQNPKMLENPHTFNENITTTSNPLLEETLFRNILDFESGPDSDQIFYNNFSIGTLNNNTLDHNLSICSDSYTSNDESELNRSENLQNVGVSEDINNQLLKDCLDNKNNPNNQYPQKKDISNI